MSYVMNVTIYTDGASSGNPGPGGYGAVLLYNHHRKELSGGFRRTTNNRMELLAVIIALEELTRSCDVVVHSDSEYVVNAVTKRWVYSWQANGWRKGDRKPALNVDLWTRLLPLLEFHNVEFRWVRGHNNNIENERCDVLAVAASKGAHVGVDVAYEAAEKVAMT